MNWCVQWNTFPDKLSKSQVQTNLNVSYSHEKTRLRILDIFQDKTNEDCVCRNFIYATDFSYDYRVDSVML